VCLNMGLGMEEACKLTQFESGSAVFFICSAATHVATLGAFLSQVHRPISTTRTFFKADFALQFPRVCYLLTVSSIFVELGAPFLILLGACFFFLFFFICFFIFIFIFIFFFFLIIIS
jgi:hypothetical protein